MKIKINKKYFFLLLIIFVIIGSFSLAHMASASWYVSLVGGIANILVSILGWILSIVMIVLIYIAQYNNFIAAPAVINGWVIVRDLCNMFFVVILLIIAFATILRLENYSYKKWLPKLILMAILINFSKTICGVLIDVAQVVMLTFVNAFKDIGAVNLTKMLGISDWQSLKGITNLSEWEVVAAMVLAVIYAVVSIIVITAMLAMLVMRIVMIWIYVVLSPLAYLLSAFPGGQSYASEWWKEFTKNLIIGPVLAFFIWLSFTALANFNASSLGISGEADETGVTQCTKDKQGECEFGTSSLLIQFVIAIGMLLGGLKIAQEIGGAAGNVVGKVASKGKGLAMKPLGWAAMGGAALARGTGRTLKNWGGDIVDKASLKAGVDFNVIAGYKRYREAVKQRRDDRKLEIRGRVLEKAKDGKTWIGRKAALFSTGDVAYDNWKEHNFFRGDAKKHIDRINRLNDPTTKEGKKFKELKEERANTLTFGESIQNNNKIKDLKGENADLLNKKNQNIQRIADLSAKEKAGTITDDEKKELQQKKDEMPEIKNQVDKNNSIIKDLSKKKLNEDRAHGLDEEIKKYEDIIEKSKIKIDERSLVSLTGARIASQSKVESEQGKVIANINNAEELVRIMKEGIRTGQQGLVSMAWKKLARTGNYNEFNKDIGVGTGWRGMLDAAKYLEEKGGFDTQTARGLVAEVGEVAKSSSMHMEAFGCMKMDKAGNWLETTEEEHDQAVLAEKTKVQSQRFCRDANRLATGYYDGSIHDEAHWRPSNSTIALYASKDAAYASDMEKTGNPSQIYFMGSNPIYLKILEDNGAPKVAQVIRDFIKNSEGKSVANYEQAIQEALRARQKYGI